MHKYFEQFKVVSIILQGLFTFFEGGNPCKIKLFTKLSTFSTKMPGNFLFSARNRMCFLFGKNDEKCRISEKALTKNGYSVRTKQKRQEAYQPVFILLITFSRVNSSRSFSSRASVMSLVRVS